MERETVFIIETPWRIVNVAVDYPEHCDLLVSAPKSITGAFGFDNRTTQGRAASAACRDIERTEHAAWLGDS